MTYLMEKFIDQTLFNGGKLAYLQIMFDREVDNMIGILLSKNRNQRFNSRIHKLDTIDKKLRDILLKRWILRCKITHSLAFFQWRVANEPNCHVDMCIQLFEDRIVRTLKHLEH